MPTTFGDETPLRLWEKSQAHKLSHDFAVKAASTVKKGQPVKLHTDGTIEPLAAADSESLRIGTSLHDAAAGELATVVLKANAIIMAKADGDTNAGRVTYTGYDATEGRPEYGDAGVTADLTHGWALEAALNDELFMVAIE